MRIPPWHAQNAVTPAGVVQTDDEKILVRVSGAFRSEQDVLAVNFVAQNGRIIRLGDIAQVTRGPADPAQPMFRVNGKKGIGLAIAIFSGHPAAAAGDPTRGAVLYKDCQLCHSIEKNDVGPMHKGIVGRISGTVPGYDYSAGLRSAKIVWTEANLDKWLNDPPAMVPDTKMLFSVESPQDRADLIAFLKERAR